MAETVEIASFSLPSGQIPDELVKTGSDRHLRDNPDFTYTCSMRNLGRCYALDGGYVMDARWNLLPCSLSPDNPTGITPGLTWRARVKRALVRRKREWKTAVWPLDRSNKGVFGWLVYGLPLLYALDRKSIGETVLLSSEFRQISRIRESLELFENMSFEFLEGREMAVVDNFNSVDAIHYSATGKRIYNGEILSDFARFAKERLEIQAGTGPEKIYISRQNSRRRLANAPEIEPLLESEGFETVFLEELSFAQQVRVLSNARTIISVHGAGMGNMIFSPPGARVIEIMHSGLTDYFSGIAAALGHDFRFVKSDPLPDRNGQTGLNSDIHADPDEIGSYLRES